MKIMFVCTGNTCRSVLAKEYFQKLLQKSGISGFEVCSAGIAASSLYTVPEIIVKLLNKEGIDVSGHISTSLTKVLVDQSDLILVMEKGHLSNIVCRYPQSKNKTFLLKEYAHVEGADVVDPIGKPEEVYISCAKEIKKCIEKIFHRIIYLHLREKENGNHIYK